MRNLYILLIFLLPIIGFSQINDCDAADVVCNNGQISFNPQGPGANDFASPNNSAGCLQTNENSSAWYYFEIEAGAPVGLSLGLTISPTGGAGQDYDFALFGPDVACTDLGAPIRCSYASPNCTFCPDTGLGNGTTDLSEGANGDGFVSEIPIEAGQGYFLLIDNFSSSGIGFNLTWTGTGASFLECNADPPCGLIADAGTGGSGCAGQAGITLNGSTTGGSPSETYSWTGSNGSTAFLSNTSIPNPAVNIPPGISGTFDFTLTVSDGGCIDDDIVSVTVFPEPTVSLTQPAAVCDDATSFSLSASPPGGVWSPNAPNGIINPLTLGSGNYTVDYTFTDANGCMGTTSTNVVINASPTVTIDPFQLQLCTNGNPIFLNASPPDGTWGPNTPGGVLIPGNLGVGNTVISYAFTDANGCSDMTDVQVTVFPEPVATITDPGILCNTGDPVFLVATPPGGTWGPNATAGVFLPSNFTTGFIPVTYTFSQFGCETVTTIDIEIQSAPAVDIQAPPPLCTSSAPFTLTATPPGGNWSSNAPGGVIDPSTLGSGSHIILYTFLAPTGCLVAEAESITIGAPPTVTVTPVGNLCENGNAQTLTASPSGGIWSSNAPGGVFTPTASGTFMVSYTFTDGATGCSETTEIDIQVVPSPTTSITGDLTFCAGNTATLTANGAFTNYNWSNSGNTSSISVSSAGTYTVTVTDASGCTATAEQTITQSSSLSPTISGGNSICDGASTMLTVQGTFNNYQWSNNGNTNSITVTTAGTYTVTVTDGSGCTGTAESVVNLSPSPTPSINGVTSFCPGESVPLSVGNFTSYQWSDNTSGNSITVNQQGTYTVTVTDTNGCTGTDQITVNENAVVPPAINGDLAFCNGESTTLTADGNFVSYTWSNGSTSSMTTVSQTGNVGVTVTDANGCTSESSVMISQNLNPDPMISGATSICPNTSTQLSVDASFTNYQWSNNTNTNSISVTQQGTFTVTVTDTNGCTGTNEVTVTVTPQLQPTINGVTTICDGASTTLEGDSGFATYLWSDNSNGQDLTVTAAGTYTLTVTDATGCTGSAEVMVNTNVAPTPVITGDDSFCAGESASLNAGAFDSYIWSENSTSQNITVSSAGTYTVTVSDINGCTGTNEIIVSENQVATPDILGDLNFCTGENTTLTADGNFVSYSWSNGNTTNTTDINQSGNITVTATDANGCTSQASVMVNENAAPTPNITGASSLCSGTSTTLETMNSYTNYQWSDNSTGTTLSVSQAGTYTLTVTDANGCTGTDEFVINVSSQLSPTISGDTQFCDGTSTTLTVDGTFDMYQWSDNTSNNTLTATESGTFTVTVTDITGCTGTAQIAVNESPTPMPQISGSTSFCTGTSTTLEAAGGNWASFIWSDNSTASTLSVSTAGTFTVTVTDDAGCTGEESITITESTSLNPTIVGNLSFCPNSSTDLDAGLGFDTYMWSDGTSNQTITVMQSGDYTVTVSDVSGCTGTAVVFVDAGTSPTPTITGPSSFCTGSDTDLDAGTGFTNYIWSNGLTTQLLNVTVSGTYTVTVTDTNGCTGTNEIQVDELASLDPNITGDNIFCEGSMTTISADLGFASYVWSDNSTDATLNILQEGTYTVTVTDAGGCTGEQSFFVGQNSNPQPMISGDLEICPNAPTTLSLSGTYDSYIWSDTSTDPNLTTTLAGTYTVTVTNTNGCTGTNEVVVDQLTAPSTIITGVTSFCPGGETMIDAGDNFDSYIWSNTMTDQVITVNQSGTYTVTITDSNGCTSTAETVISENTPTTPDIVGASSFCSGNSTILDATGNYTNYVWSDNSTDPMLTVTQSGTYTVTATDANGCTATAELMVSETVSLLPTIGGTDNFCPNESTLIEAETGFNTYMWSDGITTTSMISVTTAGTYTVTVSDVSGCTGTNSIIVTENVAPTPTIAGSSTFCIGFSSTLDAGNFTSYVWSDQSTNSTLEVDTDGIFSVTVTDDNGCTGVASLQVMQSTVLQPVISGDTNFCTGTSANLDAGAGFDTYMWSDNSNGQTLSTTVPGTYTVTVSDASGCTGETSISITENNPVNAGVANTPSSLCAVDATIINLSNELTGADANGVWTETSNNASTGIAFNTTTGEFNTDGQLPGTYTFEYFLAGTGACSDDMETVTVEVLESPIATIATADLLTCNTTSTELDASNSQGGINLIYSWVAQSGNIVDGSDTPNPTINEPGTYELTIELPNGCSSISSIIVDQNIDEPDVDAGMNQQLTCNNGQATLNGSSTIAGAIYTWSGPGINSTNMNLQNPVVTSNGTYTLIVTHPINGCESITASVEVDANTDSPVFTLNTVSALDCITSSQLLSPSITMGTNLSYQWFLDGNIITGAIDENYEATQSGIYSLEITNNDNGCDATSTVEVIETTDPPAAEAGTADQLTCAAGSVTLDGTGSTTGTNIIYQWLDPSGSPIANSNSLTIDVAQAGTFTIIVTNTTNGCSQEDQVIVQADNNFPVADAGADAILDCDFNDIQIGGNSSTGPNYVYSWTSTTGGTISNPTSINPMINEPGNYELIVTDTDNGCTATDAITISENNNVPTNIEIDLSPISCHGDNDGAISVIDVTGGTAPYDFSFNGGNFSNITDFGFLGDGEYTLSVKDALGCEFLTEVAIFEPAPFIIELGPNMTIELGEEAQINVQTSMPFDSLWWRQDATLPCDNCPDPIVSPTFATTYEASAINFNGCEATDDITIFVEKNRNVYIPNVFSPNDDGLNDIFFINGGDDVEKIHVFKIYNRWGEELFELTDFQANDITKGWDGFFRGEKMNPGVFVYFAEIEFKDGFKRIYKGDVALRR